MGINSGDLDILIELKKKGYLREGSSVVEIGAQQLANSFLSSEEKIEKIKQLFNLSSIPPLPSPRQTKMIREGLEALETNAPPARIFWKWLGFTYASIDIDGSPGSIPLDLNYDEAPKTEWGKYQLVTNFGTTEHIANQLNAFKVIHDLTAVGGVMLHNLPAQGMLNHGLVNYNMKFFWTLARSNEYQWLYVDYMNSLSYFDLPQNIIESVSQFKPCISSRAKEYKAADCTIIVALQKKFDAPYVPPLDVPAGTKTDNQILKKRYWSVFDDNALEIFQQYSNSKKKKAFHTNLMKKITDFISG